MGGKRKKDGPERDDVSAKIDREIIAWAKIVVAARGTTLARYLSEILRPVVREDRWALGDELVSDRPGGGARTPRDGTAGPGDDTPPPSMPPEKAPGPSGPAPAPGLPTIEPRFLDPNPGPPGPPPGVVPHPSHGRPPREDGAAGKTRPGRRNPR